MTRLLVVIGLLALPATAAAVPPVAVTAQGTATFSAGPSDPGGSSGVESGGSGLFDEAQTRRRIEFAVDGPPEFPLGRDTSEVIWMPIRITAVRNGKGACVVGATGTLGFGDLRPKYVDLFLNDCGINSRFGDGHAGTRVAVSTHYPADSAKPWTVSFSLTLTTKGADPPVRARRVHIGFKMPERYGDRDESSVVEAMDTPAEVDPSGGFGVRLSAEPCPTRGTRLTIDGRAESLTDREREDCAVATRLPEGDHEVRWTGKDSRGAPMDGERTIRVQDWLVLGLGDSIGSGEGNPDLPEDDDRAVARWQDRRCHRSAESYQARTARMLERHDEQTSVTFVHLACSGAAIASGLLGPYEGIVGGAHKPPLPAQLDEAFDLIDGREVDAVILSVGANDLRFGDVLQFCVKHRTCWTSEYQDDLELDAWMKSRLAAGEPRYGAVVAALGGHVAQSRVYLVQYPDPLRAPDGDAFCDEILDVTLGAVRADEASWTFENFLSPINALIQSTRGRFGWNVVGGAQQDFRRHGYCADRQRRWMVQLLESRRIQGDTNGTMHPNRRGHIRLSQLARKEIFRDLYVNDDRPRKP
ncbi:MAG: SGNH/GDSL hydrolase family protein [Solirubrobacteraceae bacterium]